MDMIDLAHMVIGIDTSWVALRAWKRSPRIIGQSEFIRHHAVRSRTRARPARSVSRTRSVSVSNNHASAVSSARPKGKEEEVTGRPVISMRTADPTTVPLTGSSMEPAAHASLNYRSLFMKNIVVLTALKSSPVMTHAARWNARFVMPCTTKIAGISPAPARCLI